MSVFSDKQIEVLQMPLGDYLDGTGFNDSNNINRLVNAAEEQGVRTVAAIFTFHRPGISCTKKPDYTGKHQLSIKLQIGHVDAQIYPADIKKLNELVGQDPRFQQLGEELQKLVCEAAIEAGLGKGPN